MDRQIRSLVVDDKRAARDSMAITLERLGHRVDQAANVEQAKACLEKQVYDLVLTDMQMPAATGDKVELESGIEVVEAARSSSRHTAIIVLTAYGNVENAVEAMRRGANDYAAKPVSIDEIKLKVEKVLQDLILKTENLRLIDENLNLRKQLHGKYEFSNIIGVSAAMMDVLGLVARAAQFNDTVLIHGETGTGKELIARAIHYNSPRRDAPFVPVNCAAIPAPLQESYFFGHERGAFTDARQRKIGYFEQSSGGTLFLDEVGDLSAEAQAKLLRVLQEREFERVGGVETIRADTRVVAASNKDLLAEVRGGTFREDLFARLDVIPIRLPSLRERPEDVPVLAQHFLGLYGQERGMSAVEIAPAALEKLSGYDWPRNVRELESVLKRALVFVQGGNVVLAEHVQFSRMTAAPAGNPGPVSPTTLREGKKTWEKSFLVTALRRNGWNVKATADEIGVQRTHLWRKIRELGVEMEKGR